jgi:eukaryotic-like serine/threonine-protein kinase
MALSPGDYLGPYRIIHLLGSGGMGEVYRAHDSRLERDVALKIMRRSSDAEHVARFSREARAAGSLNHPNIVAVYDVGEEGGVPYVVTELLEGETLRARLNRAPLPYRKAVEYGTQIAQALDAVHAKGIWHRDVKPGNVFVTNDGRVKLLDFGVAKLSEQHHFSQAETVTADDSRTGEVRGTPGYMSPEQVLGNEIDHRTDIFALGIILYEMFTGARAFQRNSTIETMNAVLQADPADPLKLKPDLAPVAAAVVRRCLEKNREDRFQSARDLAFDLQQLRDQTGTVSKVVQPPAWRRVKVQAATVAAIGLLGVALWLLWPTTVVAPSFEQLTFSRGRIGGARFASGGAAVVYSEATQGHALEISRIELADRLSTRSLNFDAGTDVLAARAGDLALLQNPRFVQGERFVGTLAQASLGGAPREIADNIEHADWSQSGELALVQTTVAIGGKSRLEYPQGQVLYTTSNASIRFARVSPDGQRVAFLEDRRGRLAPSGEIKIVDRNGKILVLTGEFESVRGLAWSANGEEVWFAGGKQSANRALQAVSLNRKLRTVYEAPGSLTLWDIASDGRVLLTRDEERRAVVALPPGEKVERDLSWFDLSGVAALSKDGLWLLCGDRFGVYLRSTSGSKPTPLLDNGWADDLSPDGKLVLATIDSSRKLVVVPKGAGSPQPLPSHGITQYNGAWWFPDGRRVLFTGKRDGEEQRSYVQDTTGGGAPTAITPQGTWGVAISPTGDSIAAIASGQGITLWPVRVGGPPKSVSGSEEGERPVAWHENGQSLWLFRRGEIPAHIYALDIATGRRQLWKTLSPPDTAGVYSIIEFQITPSGNAYAYSYTRLLSQLYLARGLK